MYRHSYEIPPFLSTAVPDFFLSLPKPKHDLVSLMVTEYAITDDGVISDLQSVEVCVVFGGGRKVRFYVTAVLSR